MKRLLILLVPILLFGVLACNDQTSQQPKQDQHLKSDTKAIYTVLLSAHNDERKLTTDEQSKVDGYLNKYQDKSSLKSDEKLLVEYINRMSLNTMPDDNDLFSVANDEVIKFLK